VPLAWLWDGLYNLAMPFVHTRTSPVRRLAQVDSRFQTLSVGSPTDATFGGTAQPLGAMQQVELLRAGAGQDLMRWAESWFECNYTVFVYLADASGRLSAGRLPASSRGVRGR